MGKNEVLNKLKMRKRDLLKHKRRLQKEMSKCKRMEQ